MTTFDRLTAFFTSLFLFLTAILSPGFDWLSASAAKASFVVDAGATGAVMGNKVSNFNAWSPAGVPAATDYLNSDPMQFVEYIQLMQATGGSAERDLFQNPLDRSVLDDYNFAPLITACRNVLALGAKPHIKTGNVPLKLTTDPQIGVFGVNVNPPDDYNQYFTYIAAVTSALVDAFGLQEVQSWRFGVMTEFENKDWFMTKDGNPDNTFAAYCKLYDYTLAALQSILGEDIDIGAHAMAVSEGLWDEGRFIEHCARGTNYYTGQTGSRLCFLTASYYDSSPAKLAKRGVAEVINALRTKAESVGLQNLRYGFDEGRIYGSAAGGVDNQLNLRIVGQTYQASYDARLLKTLAENNIDYFSSWGYNSGGMFSGYPSVACHVATQYANLLAGKRLAKTTATKQAWLPGAEISLLAGTDETARTVGLMAYNFKASLNYKTGANISIDLALPSPCGNTARVTCYLIDDDANFFDEWIADRKTHSIGPDAFAWSCDDPAIDTATTLNAPWARELYFSQLRDTYIESAKLIPVTTEQTVTNGHLTLHLELPPNAAVFYEISY